MADNNNAKIKKGYVLLFKTPKDDYIKDPYVEELEEEGFTADCASALGFKYTNQDQFWEVLQNHARYDGLILTSQRSVTAIQKIIDAHKEEGQKILKEWIKLKSYVVGVSTGEAAESLGLIPIGEETGSAEKLAEFIVSEVKEKEGKKPLVFPCVSIAMEKIPVKLEAEGIPFEALTVYETEASQDISKNLEILLKEQGIPEYIVYFSPSGIQFTVDDLKKLGYPLDSIKFVALGRSTGRRVEQAGLTLTAVAKNPTVSSLITTVKQIRDGAKS